ncbi:hypothetical protein LTS18_006959 [Coniosporium uncinatum]|uniref:Uncharacterized protein n=1 Tax=Coniosporium uncinatum TaxID=93489 RepID=A0ACC3D339_9PEZI|nr:hypothetical protein LTS18_006959 [Coniosporium uncinatum]
MAEPNGTTTPSDDITQYDLLPKMLPYLDRHLLYPLLSDLKDSPDSLRLRYECLKPTNMTDFIGDLEAEIQGLSSRPSSYDARREEVLQKRSQLESETEKLRGLLEDQEVVGNLRSDKVANLEYLEEQQGVTVDWQTAGPLERGR